MNYSKIATLGVRFFALYYILFGVSDCIYALAKMQTEREFDTRTYIVLICYRLFIGLLLNRLSLPLGRLLARGMSESDDKAPGEKP